MKKAFFVLSALLFPLSGFCFDLTKGLSLSGTGTFVHQYMAKEKGDFKDENKGSGVLDVNLSFKPTESDEVFIRASFAKGNGLKKVNPFALSPNADDLFDDLHNVNGHPRDHLQELWYSHTFPLEKETNLRITVGIIDSTSFIDDNEYAGDEIEQFLNEGLVHNPLLNLPSYDAGVALEFERGNLHLRLVGIRSKNELDKYYTWIGAQVGYKWENALGKGNYRVCAFKTNKKFESWTGSYKTLKGFGLSVDQELIKGKLGGFLRFGWQDDKAQVDYKSMFSFGLNVNGSAWKREKDEMGIGYAYLKGPKQGEISHTHLFETYLKFHLFEFKSITSHLTFDYQYMADKLRNDKKEAHILGLRFNISF